MAGITVELSAYLVGRVRGTVLLLFEATAEALHFTLGAVGRDSAAIHEARQHSTRLNELAGLLDQLEWTNEADPRPARVEAPADVLRDAVLGTLLDAGESLASDLHYGAGGVRALARDVVALDEVLREVERRR